jgi:hypothetical protein
MRNTLKILFFFITIAIFSCEDNRYFTNCDECTSEEPSEVVISAKLNYTYYEGGVLLKLYVGDIEDNVLYDSVRIYHIAKYEKKVPLNTTFTASATYTINGKKYTVINSTTPRVKYTETLCEKPCYFIYNKDLNLEYKYLK